MNCAPTSKSAGSLRTALAQLRREGLIKTSQGRRREVVPRQPAPARLPAGTVVVLLTPVPLELMPRFALYWIDDLREHLGEAGYHLEVQASRAWSAPHPGPALEALAHRLRPAGWVLYQSPARLQHACSQQGLPCVIAGSRHPGVQLPSVDLDYRAVCRHAGGLFLSKRHRRLALLNLDSGLAGDKESEAGWLEALQAGRNTGAEALVFRHDGTLGGLCRHLDALLGRPARPTAILVSNPHHVLSVMGHLNRRGVPVPREVSLISRDDESFLPHVLPTVARYSASPAAMARKVSRLVLDMVRGGTIQPRDYRLMPEFLAGESLAAGFRP